MSACAYEPLKPYLEANDARLSLIERRQALLEAENAELKAQLARISEDPLSPIGLFLSPADYFRSRLQQAGGGYARHPSISVTSLDDTTARDPSALLGESRPLTPIMSTVLSNEPATMTARRDSNASDTSDTSDRLGTPESMVRSESAPTLVPPPRPERHADRPRSRPVSERRMSRPTPPATSVSDPPPAAASRRPQTHQDWVLDRLPPPGTRAGRDTQQSLRSAILHLATGLDAAEQRSAL